jgi:hypothetical protein
MISKTLPLIALLAWPALAQERWQVGINLTALEPREWEGFDGASYSRGKVRPYVALRSAVALNQPDRPGVLANPAAPAAPADAGYQKQMLRYLEGNQESSLQFGVRF